MQYHPACFRGNSGRTTLVSKSLWREIFDEKQLKEKPVQLAVLEGKLWKNWFGVSPKPFQSVRILDQGEEWSGKAAH